MLSLNLLRRAMPNEFKSFQTINIVFEIKHQPEKCTTFTESHQGDRFGKKLSLSEKYFGVNCRTTRAYKSNCILRVKF